MASRLSAPSEVELPKSSFGERGADLTSNGTFVIPTPTSATWGSPKECHPQQKGRNAGDASKAPAGTAGTTAQILPVPCTAPQSAMGEKPLPTFAVTKQRRRHLQQHRKKADDLYSRGSTKASTTRSTGRTLTTFTTRRRTKQSPPRPRQPQSHSSSSSSSSSDSATQPPCREHTPAGDYGDPARGAPRGLAQPASPGPWRPQDEGSNKRLGAPSSTKTQGEQADRGARHRTTASRTAPTTRGPRCDTRKPQQQGAADKTS